jgi:PKD repeat protein
VTTTFRTISTGNIGEISRDFGDGTQGKGTPITHTFILPGMYNVQAVAKDNSSEIKAQTIVII